MPKVSKNSATQGGDFGPVTDRSDELEGYTVNFVEVPRARRRDPTAEGLAEDRCQCPHWGYVLSGRMTFEYPDGGEVYEAGDAFYSPPGHAPVKHDPGTEIVMFSPTHELHETEKVMQRNMQALQAG